MRWWARRLGLGLAILVLGGLGLGRLARSRTYQVVGRLVSRVETTERVVALTFDDGPSPEHLAEVLGALESRGVKATFFVIGAELAASPEAGRRLVAAGHELGFIRREVESTDELIRAAGFRGPIHFRPPYCWKLFALPWFLWRTGRTSVTWDLEPDSLPGVAATANEIVADVRRNVRPGSIILLHVWYPSGAASRAAIPAMIDALRADGYCFSTVDELLTRATHTAS